VRQRKYMNWKRQSTDRGPSSIGRSVCDIIRPRTRIPTSHIHNIMIILLLWIPNNELRWFSRCHPRGTRRMRYRTGRTTRNGTRTFPNGHEKVCVIDREREREIERDCIVFGRTDRQMDRRKAAQRHRSLVNYIMCTHVYTHTHTHI